MDSCRQFPRGFCLLSRSAFAGHASGCDRSWLPHSHLLRRLHVGRGWILPVLLLPESFHVLHADAVACEQLSGDVYRLGRLGTAVVSAVWFLFLARFARIARQESIH